MIRVPVALLSNVPGLLGVFALGRLPNEFGAERFGASGVAAHNEALIGNDLLGCPPAARIADVGLEGTLGSRPTFSYF